MATPHVAGAWAILRQADPNASVQEILGSLQQTGVPITDDRIAGGVTRPRIRILSALGIELPVPVLTSISPAVVTAWGPGLTLTVTGTDFFRSSVVQIGGISRPTTYVGPTTLTVAVPASDIATAAASKTITVFTPEPGGGTSAPLALSLRQPVLTVSETSVTAGNTVTATLTNAPGGASDWLALATAGSPATSYVLWTYVGPGATTRTWTVTVPSAGAYEFRLLLNGGYTLVATSPTVTASPPPAPTLSLSATTVPAGGQATVTLANGTGGASDWLALATVGAPDTSYLKWTNVGAGVRTRTWTVTLATPGSYEFRLFLNGGYTRAATSPVVTVPSPTLSVSATTIPVGGSVTVTLGGGTGGAADWLALAAVGAPNTSYVQWTYVGAGLTTRTWTVTLTTPASYEFRLFLNGSYTRAATSPAVTVSGGTSGSPTLTLSATTLSVGGQVTTTLANGTGERATGWPSRRWAHPTRPISSGRTWERESPPAPGR